MESCLFLKYAIKSALLLFLISLLLIAVTLFVGRQQEQPPRLEMLHLHDCQLPCWIGIIPGKTTIGEAKILLTSTFPAIDYEFTSDHSPYQDTEGHTISRRNDGISLGINFNEWETASKQTKDTIISDITLIWWFVSPLTLGQYSILLGKPQALSVTWGNHHSSPNALYYRQGVRLTLNKNDFVIDGWDVEVSRISIFSDLKSIYPSTYAVPWHGWTSNYKDDLFALMLP